MSAALSKADIDWRCWHVRFGPISGPLQFRSGQPKHSPAFVLQLQASRKCGREARMISLFHATRSFAAIMVAAVMLTSAPSRSFAETGSVRIKITKVGFIVGVGGGSGT